MDNISGKVVRGDDPRARKPAAGHGRARTRRAGCSDVAGVAGVSAAWGEGSTPQQPRRREFVAVECNSVRVLLQSIFASLAAFGAGAIRRGRVPTLSARI